MDFESILNTELSNLPIDLKKQIELDMGIYRISNEKAGRFFFVGLHKMINPKYDKDKDEISDLFKKSLEIEDNPGVWSYYTLIIIFSNKSKEEIHSTSVKWLESCIKHNSNITLASKYVERFK